MRDQKIRLKNGLAFWSISHKMNQIKDDDDDKSGDALAKGVFVNVIEINKGGWVSISPSTTIPKS